MNNTPPPDPDKPIIPPEDTNSKAGSPVKDCNMSQLSHSLSLPQNVSSLSAKKDIYIFNLEKPLACQNQ